jgi:hypothetical protein
MPTIPVRELIPVLQVAIGPVILISGVGLLLLTLSNRFGRAVDRSRALGREMRKVTEEAERRLLLEQVRILYRRARYIRLAITMAVSSVLLASVLITALFLTALMNRELGLVIALIFIGCLACLMISLGAFIREIKLSLQALKLELGFDESLDPDGKEGGRRKSR